MSLRNIQTLAKDTDTPLRAERFVNKDQVQGWLAAAGAKLKDAENADNFGGTRMDCAYDAVLMCSLAVLGSES